MVKEQGTVVQIDGDYLIVEVLQSSACKSCAARQGCGQAVMSELGDTGRQTKKNHFKILYGHHVAVGSVVELSMAEDTVSKVAMLVYLLPLLMAFIVLLAMSKITPSEPIQLVTFVAALLLTYVGISRLKIAKNSILEPKITAVSATSKGSDIIASSLKIEV